MDNYTGAISPPGLYVRALYDYEADDATSLSFRAGDVIQVLTQLESGWWDGVINGERGWFPSNYCSLVPGTEARMLDQGLGPGPLSRSLPELEGEADSEGDFEDEEFVRHGTYPSRTQQTQLDGAHDDTTLDGQEAAFWIPRADPDGRLYYFNTLTHETSLDLPLESPASANESGARAGPNAFAARSAYPSAMTRSRQPNGDEDTDADQSASERDESQRTRSTPARKRQSQLSDGASPATSIESFSHFKAQRPSKNSFAKPDAPPHPAPNFFFDDTAALPLTWDRMAEDMRRSVDRYRQVVSLQERAEYVRRAEDISDHLRLLLAAGSGTTDNHCGIPSIISSNKVLYPHFRDMMSKFSKLVLNSHIAAGDFATPDAHLKCLQDADGVLNGAFGFIEIARQQRGEEIPRLFPGFVSQVSTGGVWQNNGLSPDIRAFAASLSSQEDQEPFIDPTAVLNVDIMERMQDMERSIQENCVHLKEKLVVRDAVIGRAAHRRLAATLSESARKILVSSQPWTTQLETIDLSSIARHSATAIVADFGARKQRVYTFLAELVITVQAVGAPLADEWASNRGEPLDERLRRVQQVIDALVRSVAQVNESLDHFLRLGSEPKVASPQSDNQTYFKSESSPDLQAKETGRSLLGDISAAVSPAETSSMYLNAEKTKVKEFFGEAPVQQSQSGDDVPPYLRLDHEGEVQYDLRSTPPSIKAGTLTGLVEQLTRHDRYDAPFKVTFLLTYQSFTTAAELFEHLIRRWSIQPPPGLLDSELKIWAEKKQGPIRFRIVNVLKSWFDTYWMENDDIASKQLTNSVYQFAKNTVASSSTPGAKPLMTVIEQRLRGHDTGVKRLIPNANHDAPNPILPKNMKKFKFTDIDPLEFARQLTIVESRLYHKIKPYECLNKVWQKKVNSDEPDPAANVRGLILHSNRLTNWVAEMILQPSEPKKRAAVVKHFVLVADRCYLMNNFSTLTSIISALGTAPIHRLNRTWKETSRGTMLTLERLRKVMGSTKNFAEYREALHASNPPCIPFFGVYLTDLTFIEDGIPSKMKKSELINFGKRTKTAEVIREIQTYQNAHYNFKAVPDLQDHILSAMQNAGDVQEMYDRSLDVEPREREDEKIARLLSESGFL